MSSNTRCLSEMKEFGKFTEREQRYVRSSIENAWRDDDSEMIYEHWGKGISEKEMSIRAQRKLYNENLPVILENIPAHSLEFSELFYSKLVRTSVFDLGRGYLTSFAAYRFLYERLLTARIRPWLPSSFVSAAALPTIEPQFREVLLLSLPKLAATAPGWSSHEPTFIPEWVDKVPTI